MKQQSWHPFLMVSLALCTGTIGTALASPLYPIYQQLWHLLPSHITYIFVAYMFGCLATLLFFGRTSNSLGFLRTLQIGLVIVICGLTLSAVAIDIYWLMAGRFVIGIASGLISTSAMLGLITTIPDQHKLYAPQLSSVITVIGFGLGPFIGGLIAQFSDQPLISPYLPVIVVAFLCLLGLARLESPQFERQNFSIAPHLEIPESHYKTLFFIAGLTAFSAFGAFSLFASLSPSFVKDLIPWHGPLVSGSAIASILLTSAVVQFFARSLSPIKSLNLGVGTLMFSLILLALCMISQWSPLFFISDLLVGAGHGLGLMGAFGLIHSMTHERNRAAVMSTYLFIGYLGTIVPIIAVGYLADHFGLTFGVLSFCASIALLCLALLLWPKKIVSS
ncbi:MFS transporter [Acinetobacter radioresistens]|uniref:MFS transporter n=1 Tax=Acinetobacter TaxID=469 RepID=UPI00028D52F9|nr:MULTISPECIES: MFS transporter [Acinetobacter]MCU4516835.1 MFS transporter [Acinetobacter radioresistens]PKD83089.1 MFS transporter [Acinetobacter radioresistens]RSO68107.1 MFS transporter [Acinetobacter radioresistens]